MNETANWGKKFWIYEISLQTYTPTLILKCEPKSGLSCRRQVVHPSGSSTDRMYSVGQGMHIYKVSGLPICLWLLHLYDNKSELHHHPMHPNAVRQLHMLSYIQACFSIHTACISQVSKPFFNLMFLFQCACNLRIGYIPGVGLLATYNFTYHFPLNMCGDKGGPTF